MEPTDDAQVRRVRESLPAVTRYHYLNTGTCGPLPLSSARAMALAAREDLEEGRIGTGSFARFAARAAELRRQIAVLIGAPPGSVALTHHTTDGMNIAVGGLPWRPGDEVVTTNSEHIGALAPLHLARERYGVEIRVVDATGDLSGNLPARIEAAITRRTRLCVLSHVSYATGATLPVAAVAAVCHRQGVLVAVDGAQAVGAIPVDVAALDVDFYALSGQKWLCGPEGTGAVYVRPARIPTILPPIAGYLSFAGHDDSALAYDWHADARRFEVGSTYRPGVAGLSESLRWLTEDVGFSWAWARIRNLAVRLRELLQEIAGVQVLTPTGPEAGLIAFNVAGCDPADVVAEALGKGVLIRSIPHPACVRACTGFFNDEHDLRSLRDVVARVARDAKAAAGLKGPEFLGAAN